MSLSVKCAGEWLAAGAYRRPAVQPCGVFVPTCPVGGVVQQDVCFQLYVSVRIGREYILRYVNPAVFVVYNVIVFIVNCYKFLFYKVYSVSFMNRIVLKSIAVYQSLSIKNKNNMIDLNALLFRNAIFDVFNTGCRLTFNGESCSCLWYNVNIYGLPFINYVDSTVF